MLLWMWALLQTILHKVLKAHFQWVLWWEVLSVVSLSSQLWLLFTCSSQLSSTPKSRDKMIVHPCLSLMMILLTDSRSSNLTFPPLREKISTTALLVVYTLLIWILNVIVCLWKDLSNFNMVNYIWHKHYSFLEPKLWC